MDMNLKPAFPSPFGLGWTGPRSEETSTAGNCPAPQGGGTLGAPASLDYAMQSEHQLVGTCSERN